VPAFLVPLFESNDCHNPEGPGGGRFCSTGGGDTLSAAAVGEILAGQHEQVQARAREQEFGSLANTSRFEAPFLQDKFVASETFHRMEIPIDAVAPIGRVQAGATSRTGGPVIVDANKASFGRGMYGAPPQLVILDGKHRHAEAKARGQTTITAYVGDKALPYLRVDPFKDVAFLKLSNKALRAFPSSPRQKQLQDQLRQRARELGAHWWADAYK
jgi:hypothetical protein